MILQSVSLPRRDICPCEEMYFRRSYGSAKLNEDRITLELGDKIGFDTYFGCFCSDRWLRYTAVDSFYLGIRAHGKARCTIIRRWMEDGEFCDEQVFEETIEFDGGKSWYSEDVKLSPESVYSFELSPSEGQFAFLGAAYCTDLEPKNDVRIALDICAYKRDDDVKRTLGMAANDIFRANTPLRGRFGVIVSDNGGTLGEHATKDGSVRIVQNRNLGGVGGFTRGMMEAIKQGGFTHVLLADDDAALNPESIERTYAFLSLLREECRETVLGGALVRSDMPWLQYESGARWSGGPMEIIGHGLDLRRVADIIKNGVNSEKIDYLGWWYCCIPISKIKKIGLPMPMFIHRDDVEFGLRCSQLTTLPGVCVWHEAFEWKLPSTSEYYDVRNSAIVNALHCPDYDGAALMRYVRKRVIINLMTCRYKYAWMNLRGVRDFLEGPEFLRDTDSQELHADIRKMDYRLADITALPGFSQIKDFGGQFSTQLAEASANASPNMLGDIKDKSLNALSLAGLGGGVLPAKKETVLCVHPSPMRRCFRAGRIIHCTADRTGFEVERDSAETKKIIDELGAVTKLVKEKYEAVAKSYCVGYAEMTTASYWREILEI